MVFIAFHIPKMASHIVSLVARSLKPAWQVTVEGPRLEPGTAKNIGNFALLSLKGPWPDFQPLAADIRYRFGLESVQLTRNGIDQMRIVAQPREGILRLQSHSMKLMTKDFFVFGNADYGNEQLPVLQGSVFRVSSMERDSGDLSAQPLRDKALRAAENAVDIMGQFSEKGLEGNTLIWDEHRGMTISLVPAADTQPFDNIDVLLGLPPYKEKVTRLGQMLEDRRKALQPLPQRIELDFDGKAFIKEREIDKGRM